MASSAHAPTTTPGPADGPVGDVDALAGRFRLLADQDFTGYCPVYDRVARAIADDPASLRRLLGPAPVNRTPVLALAAIHHLVLAEPMSPLAAIYRGADDADPWPLVRDLLHERSDEVRHLMATRSIQTNEVGRSAALVPALGEVVRRLRDHGDNRPLALVEIGPSAGLNLLLDRFCITYDDPDGAASTTIGPPDSPVRLRCELRGGLRPPLSALELPISTRRGLDLAPIAVADDDQRRWLTACVWPGIPDRPERLAAAIEIALEDPPTLLTGDATRDLGPLLDALGDDVVPIVVATWALAYLAGDDRAGVLRTIDAVGERRTIALLTAEVAHVTPWVPPTDPAAVASTTGPDDDADGTLTVVGLHLVLDGAPDDQALAIMHPHGRWLGWLTRSER
ncbi:DUF2332 domain-containing protein [Rhabdothermincola salaria]|uniref:DUF2332 domain-containing protein n=1 Tax=Rhabdothermincola salaria TaxID=2903142 RepID=UPI001E442EDC|nr:DUF2332 domain-containing protein [Rhabdothermincola salaria]MCD9623545.1 DUF2332 domain-containing protein [Rhabdothermincola salaria]